MWHRADSSCFLLVKFPPSSVYGVGVVLSAVVTTRGTLDDYLWHVLVHHCTCLFKELSAHLQWLWRRQLIQISLCHSFEVGITVHKIWKLQQNCKQKLSYFFFLLLDWVWTQKSCASVSRLVNRAFFAWCLTMRLDDLNISLILGSKRYSEKLCTFTKAWQTI